jgi:hypothetical protein
MAMVAMSVEPMPTATCAASAAIAGVGMSRLAGNILESHSVTPDSTKYI